MVIRFLPPAFAITLAVLPVSPARAEVTVNPAIPVTNTVTVQPIRVKKTDGSAAVVMGEGATREYITDQINIIMAQSGISVNWLPVTEMVDDFAYEGSGNYSTSVRPSRDFNTVMNGISPAATAISMVFVEIVPNFTHLDENHVNGYAWIDESGIMMHVGANLLGFDAGRDVIASVIAHEISHNLGLEHVSNSDNLMKSSARSSERLTSEQTSVIFTDEWWDDGYELLGAIVSESNYSAWARNLGLTGDPGDDDDHDGLANVLEFMLNLDGAHPDNHAMPAPVWGPAGLTWTLQKVDAALQDGLNYAIEVSDDAKKWFPAGTPGTASTVLADTTTTYSVLLNAGSTAKFMRINIDLTGTVLGGSQSLPAADAGARSAGVAPPPREQRTSDCGTHGCGHRVLEAPAP